MKSVSSGGPKTPDSPVEPTKTVYKSISTNSLPRNPTPPSRLDLLAPMPPSIDRGRQGLPVVSAPTKALTRADIDSFLTNRHATVISRTKGEPRQALAKNSVDDSFISYGSEKTKPIDLSSKTEVHAGIRIITPMPPSISKAFWNSDRLKLHWAGRKRGAGRATGHKNEFLAAPGLGIKTAEDYGRASIDFMTRPLAAHDHVIERVSYNGEFIRYDFRRNLLGSMNPSTGQINTFFRPGFRLGQPEGFYPSTLEPNMRGYIYTKFYVETGTGPVDRKKTPAAPNSVPVLL